MRRALRLYVVLALLVALALFAATGVKVYATWSDEPEAKATSTTTVSPEPTTPEEACSNPETYWTPLCQGDEEQYEEQTCLARCQRAATRKPQQKDESCLYRHGRIKWCLTIPEGEEWWIGQYDGREHRGRYYLENHKGEVQGYLRPTSYGWRAMGNTYEGWARGGRVVRTGQRNVLYVYEGGKGYTARGALAVEVAAYKLIYGDCKEPWTDTPCRNGVGQ
jgi:hypothetical protein